jgi:hypothetical protein
VHFPLEVACPILFIYCLSPELSVIRLGKMSINFSVMVVLKIMHVVKLPRGLVDDEKCLLLLG